MGVISTQILFGDNVLSTPSSGSSPVILTLYRQIKIVGVCRIGPQGLDYPYHICMRLVHESLCNVMPYMWITVARIDRVLAPLPCIVGWIECRPSSIRQKSGILMSSHGVCLAGSEDIYTEWVKLKITDSFNAYICIKFRWSPDEIVWNVPEDQRVCHSKDMFPYHDMHAYLVSVD